MRNSSLVECPCADNVTGLKQPPEATDVSLFLRYMVGERCGQRFRSHTERGGGAPTSENAGMSSVNGGKRTHHTGSLRVPGQRQTSQGKSDPKPRPL